MPRDCSVLQGRPDLHACGCSVCETACADFTGTGRKGGALLGSRQWETPGEGWHKLILLQIYKCC
jgi:hypothetical protein